MLGDDKQLTSQQAKVLVAYYSATGHVHALAKTVAQGRAKRGRKSGYVTSRSSRRSC
jgi:hypothetical protein